MQHVIYHKLQYYIQYIIINSTIHILNVYFIHKRYYSYGTIYLLFTTYILNRTIYILFICILEHSIHNYTRL